MFRRLIVFFGVLISLSVCGKTLRFEHYSDEEGLSHNSIRSILQDRNGFIWLGTFGGVNRFDGYNFKAFTSKINNLDYLQDDDITQLVMDEKENIWIGTSNGLTRFHIPTSTFTTFHPDSTHNNQLCGNKIRSLFIDNQKRIWIGTKNHGFCYFNPGRNEFIKVETPGVEYIRAITQTKDNTIWIGTYGKGVYALQIDEHEKLQNLTHYPIKYSFEENELNHDVHFVYEDHKLDVFVGTRGGLFKLNKVKGKFELMVQKDVPIDFFRCITRGPNGKYWIGTLNGIIVCDSLEEIPVNGYERHVTDLSHNRSLGDNYISSLFFDQSGVLWIGTENGLDKCDPFDNQFKVIRGQSLSENVSPIISSYGKTYDSNLLIGTHSNGLHMLKNNNLERISSKDLRITSIYTWDGKVFYCGLWDGKVLKYNYLNSKMEILDIGIIDSPIFSFLKISSSKLLIGTNGEGLIEYDLSSKKNRKLEPDILGKQQINKIVKTHAGLIWLGTENGIFKYDLSKGVLKNYKYTENSNSGLSNDKIKDIIIDEKGKVWAATRHGLNYYDPLTDDFVTADNPIELKDIWITDMTTDSLGQMWLNINYNQLARYNPRNNDFHIFPVNTGVRSTIYNKRGFLYFSHSRIYMGGLNGIIFFDPLEIIENRFSPKPFVSEFMVQNKEVLPGDIINGQEILSEDINYAKEVVLNHDNRDFSVSFSTSSYVNERHNKYQYMLKGFNIDWIDVGSDQRSVQYTNLKPDEYEFLVRAKNNNGYWSEVSSYKIHILPPFWLSLNAYVIYLILLFLISYQVRKLILFRVKIQQELLLEKVKREKEENLSEEKLRFFTNISHELKTPLTLIMGPARQLLEKKSEAPDNIKKYKLIHSNASRLLDLVNQVIDFRKAEQGKMKLKVSEVEIVSFTEELFAPFQLMADEKQLAYSFICNEDKIEGWLDRNKYERVIFNLLSNAFKYTNQGEVRLALTEVVEDKRYIEIAITDTGVGIPEDRQEKIFSRFFQVEEQMKYNTGSGIGLSLVKSLVENHHGKVWFKSKEGEGAVFYVRLPISKEVFETDELFEHHIEEVRIDSKIEEYPDNIELSFVKNEKVLVIEDNAELRNYIMETLSDKYQILEAPDGAEGLEIVKKEMPDIVVSDVMMERMDGFEFCKNLKSDDNISHIPVILLTALSEIENQKEGFKIGADAYIAKPFDPSLLKVRLSNILENRRTLKERYATEPDMELDQLSHSVADDEFIKKIKVFIEESINNPELNKELLCKEFGISSSKLYRKVKELADLSPNEMIRTIRLKKAFELLKKREYNVSEVAYEVGFSDPLYFSRCFKKQFGYPPSKIFARE